MTKTLYAATSAYVGEINKLPVKRQVSVSGILKKLDVSRSGYNAWNAYSAKTEHSLRMSGALFR